MTHIPELTCLFKAGLPYLSTLPQERLSNEDMLNRVLSTISTTL